MMDSCNGKVSSEPERKKTWERRILDAKKKHRPGLKNWWKDRYALDREPAFHALRNPIDYSGEHYRIRPIPKLNAHDLTVEEFLNHYEKQSIPIIIQNIPQKEGWKSWTEQTWNFNSLLQNYSNDFFKCGEDDDGYKINIKLKYFLKYIRHNQDDSPLYIFDSAYADIPKNGNMKNTNAILQDYRIPSYFPYDLFESVGEKRRPPYRWFLIGPERSGSTIHIDPLGTSAWNTLLVGRKRWIIFPPELKKDFVKGKEVMLKGEDDEAINYFVDIFPRMKGRYLSVNASASEYKNLWAYEFIQEAGETVFVPSGWWHCVLNLDDTIAITQNYCSYNNFDIVWRKTRIGRKKMAVKWLKQLKDQHPTLFQRAFELNRLDNFDFVQWKDPIPTFPLSASSAENQEEEEKTGKKSKKSHKEQKKRKKEKKSKTESNQSLPTESIVNTAQILDQTSIKYREEVDSSSKRKHKKRDYDEMQETNTDTTKESDDNHNQIDRSEHERTNYKKKKQKSTLC